jgi:hypothetical protein
MCSENRVIARLSEYRFVSCCNCCGGIIHLAWDNLILSLSPQDFAKLDDFLSVHPGLPEAQREGFLEASTKAGSTRLWVGNAGIRLERLEWGELRHLCFMARQKLAQAKPTTAALPMRVMN